MRTRQKATEVLLRQKRSEQSEVEQQIHSIELQLSQLAVKHEDLAQRVAEELGLDLAEAYENFQQQEVDWQQVSQEIKMLRDRIERLGNVNIDAIEQQQDLQERFEVLR